MWSVYVSMLSPLAEKGFRTEIVYHVYMRDKLGRLRIHYMFQDLLQLSHPMNTNKCLEKYELKFWFGNNSALYALYRINIYGIIKYKYYFTRCDVNWVRQRNTLPWPMACSISVLVRLKQIELPIKSNCTLSILLEFPQSNSSYKCIVHHIMECGSV